MSSSRSNNYGRGGENNYNDKNRRGRNHGRGRGRDRQRRAVVDQTQWRSLDKNYREWLVKFGLAVNAAAFNALSLREKIDLEDRYESRKAKTNLNGLLLEVASRNMAAGWEKISENRTSRESETAKEKSIRYYGLYGKNHCQILGNGTKNVVNAHIWPHNNRENLVLVSLEEQDIDNPKNILRLHSAIEWHFDRFFLTFEYSGGDFILKILDLNIRTFHLKDTNPPLTFGDIDGRKLLFPTTKRENRPWRRLLAAHSIFAHRKARENGFLQDDQVTSAEFSAMELMKFSLDDEAQARIKLLLNDGT
jgi:HNH endonuclease